MTFLDDGRDIIYPFVLSITEFDVPVRQPMKLESKALPLSTHGVETCFFDRRVHLR